MNPIEYHIRIKDGEGWFSIRLGSDFKTIRLEYEALRRESPEKNYKLVKVTTKEEVVSIC